MQQALRGKPAGTQGGGFRFRSRGVSRLHAYGCE